MGNFSLYIFTSQHFCVLCSFMCAPEARKNRCVCSERDLEQNSTTLQFCLMNIWSPTIISLMLWVCLLFKKWNYRNPSAIRVSLQVDKPILGNSGCFNNSWWMLLRVGYLISWAGSFLDFLVATCLKISWIYQKRNAWIVSK